MMEMQEKQGYYTARKGLLLKVFDKLMQRGQKLLAEQYDETFAATVVPDMRRRFEEIIPEIPYLGGMRNVFTEIILLNGMLVAIHKVLKENGRPVEDTIRFYCSFSQGLFDSLPDSLLTLGGKAMLSRPSGWLFKKQAARSQKREYAQDWVFDFVDGDEETFDYGLQFSECAVIKFYDAQGVPELKPYCNFFDIIMGRAMHMGCVLATHIGCGDETCFFQYRQGRETPVPERLQEWVGR